MASIVPGSVGGVRDKAKVSSPELRLKRVRDLCVRLETDLARPRIRTSEACQSIIQYTKTTKDFMVPSVWGTIDKREDPYNPPSEGGCCSVM
ncbi:GGL domain-containing protein [Lipomyces tetrasporus]|uniref:Guanine nucleotide-binding protein subunit gamma n=1 Tax=Lipomyces tetrasporus TaxID=54092 RepID=A0AAD7QP59_9ASCO|nr:GGL domain-containing protein [Lipomyces tetrasporus]KAJ8098733.1 GGL domain-containing protein [Lipomyces tetrasporus]